VHLDELVLYNFGVYQGRQTCQLTTTISKTPVVLIGGANGGGKSTLMDALQLALYGKRARCHNRGQLAYDEFLRQSINRNVSARDGAGLELQFRFRSGSKEQTYRITRYWSSTGKRLREDVAVMRDGSLDRALTDSWDEYVETLLPVGLSTLFFFDGEQIKALADIKRSAEFLKTAMHSLLGLDLVERLDLDLDVLQRRKQAESKDTAKDDQIDKHETQIQQLKLKRTEAAQELAAARARLDVRKTQCDKLETKFKAEGGLLAQNRNEIEARRTDSRLRLGDINDRLREYAAGVAPLGLTTVLLAKISDQQRMERKAAAARDLDKVLVDRDESALAAARELGADNKFVSALQDFLDRDRHERRPSQATEAYLHLSKESGTLIEGLLATDVTSEYERVTRLLDELETTESKLDALDAQLASTPDEDALAKLIATREEARTKLELAQRQVKVLETEAEELDRVIVSTEANRARQHQQWVDKNLEHEEGARISEFASRIQVTLSQFQTSVIEKNVKNIEELILTCFQTLIRKKQLVTGIRIDPKRFTITLRGADGKELHPDRLSSGERQLFATAMLWALRQTAGRPLPVVIDTPLARLDKEHRDVVVRRYFPVASHQVLLLSTDEEITHQRYNTLKPSLAHSYNLEFDESEGATTINPGYFW
jgi:DNA sulfur modification protein DndD